MPSNEIKRQFTLGKMEKDKDDRLVEPGAYRDANNVDVSRSEGDDSGALQVVRGNIEEVNQTINWTLRTRDCSELPRDTPEEEAAYQTCISERNAEIVKSGWGETIGVYPYPQEEKIYFFNTGRPINPDEPDLEQPQQNAIYEFDQVNQTVSPIIIETVVDDYEAGGSGRQDFIGEIRDTQVWGKDAYVDDTEITSRVFDYYDVVSTETDDQAIVQLNCASTTVVETDSEGEPVCRIDGECDGDVCTCGSADNCQEVTLFFKYDTDTSTFVCSVDGTDGGTPCICGSDNCEYIQIACGGSGGQSRTTEACTSDSLPDNINFELKSNLEVQLQGEVGYYDRSKWTYDPEPQTDIQYQVITQDDLNNTGCTPNPSLPQDVLGDDKYTLNGNGADLTPEEFCDPRCDIFNPYPDYCAKTPILNNLYDTVLTDAAQEHNSNRTISLTDVPGVNDGDTINITVFRYRPEPVQIGATFNGGTERYDFKEIVVPDGVTKQTAANAIIVKNMDALDFQQFDAIFGNVGLASRPVGYTYRVARSGNLSWTPNSDDPFQVVPDNDSNVILSNINPNDASIPPSGGEGESLVFDVEVDRQQTYEIDTDEIDENDIPFDDNTKLP